MALEGSCAHHSASAVDQCAVSVSGDRAARNMGPHVHLLRRLRVHGILSYSDVIEIVAAIIVDYTYVEPLLFVGVFVDN